MRVKKERSRKKFESRGVRLQKEKQRGRTRDYVEGGGRAEKSVPVTGTTHDKGGPHTKEGKSRNLVG